MICRIYFFPFIRSHFSSTQTLRNTLSQSSSLLVLDSQNYTKIVLYFENQHWHISKYTNATALQQQWHTNKTPHTHNTEEEEKKRETENDMFSIFFCMIFVYHSNWVEFRFGFFMHVQTEKMVKWAKNCAGRPMKWHNTKQKHQVKWFDTTKTKIK